MVTIDIYEVIEQFNFLEIRVFSSRLPTSIPLGLGYSIFDSFILSMFCQSRKRSLSLLPIVVTFQPRGISLTSQGI